MNLGSASAFVSMWKKNTKGAVGSGCRFSCLICLLGASSCLRQGQGIVATAGMHGHPTIFSLGVRARLGPKRKSVDQDSPAQVGPVQ